MTSAWREPATTIARRAHVAVAASGRIVPEFVMEERRRERAERKRLAAKTMAAEDIEQEATAQ
jgi:hypothetical protein